jgi:hypothetical protein
MATSSNALPGWFKRKRSQDESTGPAADGEPVEDAAAKESSATTGGGGDQEPVIVWDAANRLEAEIVAGRLRSENIPAIIRGEALGAIYGLTTGGLAATVVLVPAPLAAKALEILYSDIDWDESADADFGTEPL